MDDTPQLIFNSKKRKRITQPRQILGDEQEVITDNYSQDGLQPLAAPTRRLKKQGISFEVGARTRDQSETSLITVPRAQQRPIQSERFVAATGRAVVPVDKHMSAFVDAKLAEIRFAEEQNAAKMLSELPESTTQTPNATEQSTHSSGRVKMQPIPRTKNNRYQRFRRRQPAGPTETDIARDDLVDQLMQEGALPIYDNVEQDLLPVNDGQDRDNAAAAAFKANFLATLGDKRHGKKATTSTQPNSGPKLGGSRSAREKMKSTEDTNVKK